MTLSKGVLLAILGAASLGAQATITEVKIHADPGPKVRPMETIALQVRAYGRAGSQEGRIHRDGAEFRLLDENGGRLSKPFRFQGEDNERFIDEYQSTIGQIFGQLSSQYVNQDAVIYVAPEKPGTYRVEAALGGEKGTLSIEVDPNAGPLRKPEKTSFDPEPVSLDPYRDLAAHWAPLIAQETWWQPKSDYITRFDYDGDWKGDNNWANLEEGTSQAYVYYAAMETSTHWFLIYNVFHPRDYSDKCVAGSCHENDNEGLILTLAKDGSPYGRLQVMETLAHNNIYSFTADGQVSGGAHGIDGRIGFHGHRPVVFIESGGHGIYGTASSHARYDIESDVFTAGTGVTYAYKGQAERPKHPNDRWVGYDLLPIYQEWWLKTAQNVGRNERVFDDFYSYEPDGGRPRAAIDSIGGAFLGREAGDNKAKPFWGWHDTKTRKAGVLATGQWGLDPAYGVSRNLTFPGQFSTDYVFNPYLEAEPVSRRSSPAPDSRSTAQTGSPAQGGPLIEPQGAATPTSGAVEFRLWVDGTVEVRIQGDRIGYSAVTGAPYRDEEHRFSSPLPAAEVRLRARVREGRGKVRLVEGPSARNSYTTLLRIDDSKRAGDVYHVLLEWQR